MKDRLVLPYLASESRTRATGGNMRSRFWIDIQRIRGKLEVHKKGEGVKMVEK